MELKRKAIASGKLNDSGPKGKAAKARPVAAARNDSDGGSPTDDLHEDQDPRGAAAPLARRVEDDEDFGGRGSGSDGEFAGADSAEGDGDEEGDDDDDDEEEELGLLPDEFGDAEAAGTGDGDDDDGAEDSSSSDRMTDDDDSGHDGRDADGDTDDDADDEDDDDDDDYDGGDEDAEARRRSGSQAGTADGSDGGGGGFMQGAKGASFAKAFSKVLATKTKAAKAGAAGEAPILAASKSLAKRQAEEDADAAARREAKRARLERRQRGHVAVPRRGVDPGHDQLEKQLGRLATKGVVMLFNAIATAQKIAKAGAAAGAAKKPAKLSKASFLAQLKAGGGGAGGGVLSTAAAAGGDGAKGAAAAAADAPGWKVLQAGFSGLSGGGGGRRMKDWDRKPTGSDEEDARNMGVGLAGGGGGSSSEGEGDEDGGW